MPLSMMKPKNPPNHNQHGETQKPTESQPSSTAKPISRIHDPQLEHNQT